MVPNSHTHMNDMLGATLEDQDTSGIRTLFASMQRVEDLKFYSLSEILSSELCMIMKVLLTVIVYFTIMYFVCMWCSLGGGGGVPHTGTFWDFTVHSSNSVVSVCVVVCTVGADVNG